MTVVVRGLRELNRDFGKLSKSVQRELQAELRRLAEPVARDVAGKASQHRFSGPTVAGIRAGSRSGAAVVRQIRRKTTGSRPDFGATQMRYAFLPAAQEDEPKVVHEVEAWLGRLTAEHGLGMGGLL